jgi:hypothetical protein
MYHHADRQDVLICRPQRLRVPDDAESCCPPCWKATCDDPTMSLLLSGHEDLDHETLLEV